MKKSLLGLVTLLLLASVSAFAQTVTGKVTSAADGAPIPGVSVIIKGTSVGTSTDTEGKFTLTAPSAANDVLVISFIGFATQEISLQDRTNVDVVLKEDATELNEVVVTALGIERDRKSLGYSVTEVKGEQFTQAREVNVANSLVGKVAGVNVSAVNGGPGASTSVLIRGISSLTQSNQPLYVINGVPMSNESTKLQGRWVNEPDKGDGISNLNPDDIESISVLKGGSAAALYGSRAKAGVILITTKSGKGEGSVELNSNYVFESIIDLTDWQASYGQGTNGLAPTTKAGALAAGGNTWGAPLDGSDVMNFDGVARPYVAHTDNMDKFYRTGSTFTNTVSFSKGFGNSGGMRLSASDLSNRSVIPNSGLDRNTFNLSINVEPVKRLKIDARANFILDDVKNRPMLNDGAGNGNFQAMFLPISWDINTLKPGTTETGYELVFGNNTYATNPWFAVNNFVNNTKRERFIGSMTARYTFDNNFFIQGRVGRDSYTDRITGIVPSGTAYKIQGSINETTVKFYEMNADFLVGKTFNIGTDFTVAPSVGGNLRKQQEERFILNGDQLAIPFVYNMLNPKSKSIDYKNYNQEVQSFYGVVDFSYKNFLFLTATGRNDWFSTLAVPGLDDSDSKLDIFYPSVNGSFVFSEIAELGPVVTFGKLRAGYSKVGGATDPYQTILNYGFDPRSVNGTSLGTIINDAVPNSTLAPSEATEIEVGTELGFFGNRLRLDLSWYNKKSTNEIIRAPASGASGYNFAVLNLGELRNKGIEMLVTAVPVQDEEFRWTTSLNGSYNQNEVLALAAGQTSLGVNDAYSGTAFTRHVVGLPAHQIMAYDYLRDDDGNIVYSTIGTPQQGELNAYGSAIPKWTVGFNNEFSYKNFTLGFLIDGKFGGKVFSGTNYFGYRFGLHKETLALRDGVLAGDGTTTTAQRYYTDLTDKVSAPFVDDASFIKFRQFSLGYAIPVGLFGGVVKSATLSFVGRNLLILMKKTDNIDPEANYSAFSPGIEQGGVPPTRTYGFNLNVKF